MAPVERSVEVKVVGLKLKGRTGNPNSFTLMRGNKKSGRWFGLRASHQVVDSSSKPSAFDSCPTRNILLNFSPPLDS